ncbi:hypothetical protein V8F06_008977 [Rhypophila decipiens]
MKVTSILIGTITALLAGVVSAAAEEEQKAPDYVVKTVVDAYNAELAENKHELIKRAACARNNCLRALAARTNLARHFCASYTNTIAATVGVFSQQCRHDDHDDDHDDDNGTTNDAIGAELYIQRSWLSGESALLLSIWLCGDYHTRYWDVWAGAYVVMSLGMAP